MDVHELRSTGISEHANPNDPKFRGRGLHILINDVIFEKVEMNNDAFEFSRRVRVF